MALPGVPANLSARPGPEPQSIYVNADAVVATPTVDSYDIFVDTVTGVGAAQFKATRTAVDPDIEIKSLPQAGRYFVTIRATNSEGDGAAATEVEVVPSG